MDHDSSRFADIIKTKSHSVEGTVVLMANKEGIYRLGEDRKKVLTQKVIRLMMESTHILLFFFWRGFGLSYLNISPIYYLNCFLFLIKRM